ncbi:hypothetical protein CRG98_021204 [Punica granatum]|uniref:Uncharacterized protein n=1 Tax=Punica granatum TaxID=22663 RepID=A0A2I0JSE0_PUNGR|nr:hypothetical protein CRG98_021204 [Punica granatum]
MEIGGGADRACSEDKNVTGGRGTAVGAGGDGNGLVKGSRRWRSLRRGRLGMSRNRWVDFLEDINSVLFRHPEALTSGVSVRRQLQFA